MDFLWQDMMHAPFWIAALQIIGVNVILSGDNAVVIALACMTLPPRQRVWGMVLGAGVAVLLRVVFTLVVAEAISYPFLKLVGGALLFWVAIKLLIEDADGEKGGVEAAENLWRAVRIVAIADVVMSLDNVIAIAASAEIAAASVDVAHASATKAALIVFGLATSIPLIVAGGALLGWVAGDIMATDPVLATWLAPAVLHHLHLWSGPLGALVVVLAGYAVVGRHRRMTFDEVFAGGALAVWIAVDLIGAELFAAADPLRIWTVRGILILVLIAGYFVAGRTWRAEDEV